MPIHHRSTQRRYARAARCIGPLLVTFVFAALANQAAAQIRPVDLGTLGGTYSTAVRVNAGGHIVGNSTTAGDVAAHAFSWTASGGMLDIGTLGGRSSFAIDVNTSGQVVGGSTTAGDVAAHAFSWTAAGGIVDLGTLGGTSSFATGVNASGQVVGDSAIAGDLAGHAFFWTTAGGMVDLGTLGGSSSSALFVDASGQVVGTSYTAGDAAFHVFRWTAASGMVDLGTLGGTSSFVGEAFPGPERWFTPVNSKGQVVGASTTASDAEWHAFSWTAGGGMVDLGALGGSYTVAVGVSGSGQVVGWSAIAGDSTIHAFSWTPADGMVDLRTLSGSGQSLAFGVNAAGQVVGSSTTAGAAGSHPFMWTAAGGMVDLGTLGGTYGSAYSINNNGIAAGESTLANESLHATLWQLPRPPRCGTARPDRPVLWPPNHKLVPVQIVGISDPDNHSLTTTITAVTQDEPGNGRGDGNTSRDAIIQQTRVLLRAEREGGSNGRVYRVHFRADNGLGGVCSGSVPVIVPKNMKSARAVVDDGQRYDSTRQ